MTYYYSISNTVIIYNKIIIMNLIELTDPRTNWGIKRRDDGRK